VDKGCNYSRTQIALYTIRQALRSKRSFYRSSFSGKNHRSSFGRCAYWLFSQLGSLVGKFMRPSLWQCVKYVGENGCQAKRREKAPLVFYVHCVSHQLNLAVVSTIMWYAGCQKCRFDD